MPARRGVEVEVCPARLRLARVSLVLRATDATYPTLVLGF